MDRMGLLIYQGIITLIVLAFMFIALNQTQNSIHKANETLICVLSVPPNERTVIGLEDC